MITTLRKEKKISLVQNGTVVAKIWVSAFKICTKHDLLSQHHIGILGSIMAVSSMGWTLVSGIRKYFYNFFFSNIPLAILLAKGYFPKEWSLIQQSHMSEKTPLTNVWMWHISHGVSSEQSGAGLMVWHDHYEGLFQV